MKSLNRATKTSKMLRMNSREDLMSAEQLKRENSRKGKKNSTKKSKTKILKIMK